MWRIVSGMVAVERLSASPHTNARHSTREWRRDAERSVPPRPPPEPTLSRAQGERRPARARGDPCISRAPLLMLRAVALERNSVRRRRRTHAAPR
jgi:hypothetical protein